MNSNINATAAQEKREWVRPTMRRLAAGAAESRQGGTTDGGGGFQGS